MATIKFGTSGWREIIAREFTFDNVQLATQAIADYLNAELKNSASPIAGRKPVIILGHDTRFLGRHFSLAAAEVLEANGITPLLCDRDTPTPVIAHTISATIPGSEAASCSSASSLARTDGSRRAATRSASARPLAAST